MQPLLNEFDQGPLPLGQASFIHAVFNLKISHQ